MNFIDYLMSEPEHPFAFLIAMIAAMGLITGLIVLLFAFLLKDDEACQPERGCLTCKHAVGKFYDGECAKCQASETLDHWEQDETIAGYMS